MAKSSAELFCFILGRNFSISLWERPKTPHVHDFGISGRVHDSQNKVLLLWRRQDTLKNRRKSQIIFKNHSFRNSKLLETEIFENVGRTATENHEGPS